MKEQSHLLTAVTICLLCSFLIPYATGYVRDVSVDPNALPAPLQVLELTAALNDPDAACLVYDAGDGSIVDAMANIGATNVRVRSNSSPVTTEDWQWCDIVIIGANSGNDSLTGIDAEDIDSGIQGRVILSGHDADLHASDAYSGDTQWAAQTFLAQAIDYVLSGPGKGLVGFGDSSAAFEWAPASWGLTCTKGFDEETVTSFTSEGLASGVYDDLTPELMSDWAVSFHVRFDDYSDGFVPFELGEFNQQQDVVTIAAPINPRGFYLEKYDDIPDGSCVNINDPIGYTVTWNNTTDQTFCDAYILDVFPVGVTYPVTYSFDPNTWEMVSSDPLYQEDHTYLYPIGTLSPNESGVLYLDVIVNSAAEPGYKLHNVAELWATVYDPNGQYPEERLIATAFVDTLACCWDTNGILYVDKNATGSNTGVSWENAYTSLDSALTRARETQCTFDYVIYVAQGTYAPTNATNGFVLPDNVSVYGGFPVGGCDFADRNPKRYETILSGLIDETTIANKIVTMGDETLLDGFTISNGFNYNIYGNGVDFAISHCTVKDCLLGFGIYAFNCGTEIRRTSVSNNRLDGLYHEGQGHDLKVDTSWLLRNGAYGIYSDGSTPTIMNSIVSESSMTEQGRQAIHIKNPKYQPKLYNLTVANNRAAGLHFEDDGNADSDPNNLDYPDLQNSILFFNGGDSQISGFNPDIHANFCCIQDCNTLDTTNFNDMPGFAYQVLDPNGVPSGLPDPNNYHLAPNSVCIDRVPVNPAMGYEFQTDYDGELRLFGDYVDVGADEVYNCYDEYVSEADVHNDLDWDADGIVNLVEFNAFSRAWLSRSPDEYIDSNLIDPNAIANWNPKCNLADTGTSQYVIDLADLMNFVEDTPWLWIACWKLEEINAMTAMMSGGEESMLMGGEEQIRVLSTEFMETEALQTTSELEIIQPEPTVEEQIFQLQDTIAFLEQIWLEEPDLQQEISAEDWQEFLDAIYQNLADLQTGTVQIE